MSIRNDGAGDRPTNGSFADHGIPDGRVLLTGAARAIGAPPEETAVVDDLLLATAAAAFRESFAAAAGERPPDDVEAAIDDAVAWTRAEAAGERVHLRDRLLPAFYRRLDRFHDAYHDGDGPVVTV